MGAAAAPATTAKQIHASPGTESGFGSGEAATNNYRTVLKTTASAARLDPGHDGNARHHSRVFSLRCGEAPEVAVASTETASLQTIPARHNLVSTAADTCQHRTKRPAGPPIAMLSGGTALEPHGVTMP